MEIIRYSREWFYIFFLIPILILIYWYYEKEKRNIEKYFSAENYKSLIGNFSFGKNLQK